MADVTFEQIKDLIAQMPSTEVELLRDWLNNPTEKSQTWDERLVALVNEFDLDEADRMDIVDPEAWVRQRRSKY